MSELSIAQIWIRLPSLRLHLFNKKIHFSIALAFGKPLKLDFLTFRFSRLTAVRILIEEDVTKNLADEIWIGTQLMGYWQRVKV